jgi:SAM-dependent methyltransferase
MRVERGGTNELAKSFHRTTYREKKQMSSPGADRQSPNPRSGNRQSTIANGTKDLFSAKSDLYARFRPSYPRPLFDFLLSLVPARNCAWDCATGNGQVAAVLAEHFEKVYATDISQNQIRNAVARENIMYRVERAEQSSFEANVFDLITVGQAAHWFSLPAFYKEATRSLKPNGIVALFGYYLPSVDRETDEVITTFYRDILRDYWDPERKLVEQRYQTIPFPFEEITFPPLTLSLDWACLEFMAYVGTWSAVQRFEERTGNDPLDLVKEKMNAVWPNGQRKQVLFPVFARIGRKN